MYFIRAGQALFLVLCLAVAGCTTVIKTSSPIDQNAESPEREALIDAAKNAAWAPWPKPSSSSLAEIFVGGDEVKSVKTSRDEAIAAYVASLSSMPDAKTALIMDAGRHLEAADRLRAAADSACDHGLLRLADVALLEDAIADFRETRSIYIAALKKIGGEKPGVEELKRQFDNALKALGEAADSLAENAMNKRSDFLAGNRVAVAISSGSN